MSLDFENFLKTGGYFGKKVPKAKKFIEFEALGSSETKIFGFDQKTNPGKVIMLSALSQSQASAENTSFCWVQKRKPNADASLLVNLLTKGEINQEGDWSKDTKRLDTMYLYPPLFAVFLFDFPFQISYFVVVL